jgi:hypothetical protein
MVFPQKLYLNTTTRYYIAYNCNPYDILGIFTRVDPAIECLRWTYSEYLQYEATDPFGRDVISYDHDLRLLRNLSMWEVLELISDENRFNR